MNFQRFQNPAREPRDEDAEIERDEERGDAELNIERNDLDKPKEQIQLPHPKVTGFQPKKNKNR